MLACATNGRGEYIAEELVMAQTLENLERFSTRLDKAHDVLIAHGECTCLKTTPRKQKPKRQK